MNFSISWLFSLSVIAAKASSFRLLLNVLFSNLSQVFLVVSLFLPLKALILMGSQGIPSYFPSFFQNYTKDILLVAFFAIAVLLYFLHILLDYFVSINTIYLSKIIVEKRVHLHAFEGEYDFCAKIFERVSRALSAFCFIFLCLFASWKLSVYMLALLLSVTTIIFIIFLSVSLSKMPHGFSIDTEKFENTLKFLSPVGFFLFSFFLIFYIHDAFIKNFFLSVLSIFAARQFFQRLNLLLVEMFFIEKNHYKMSKMLSLKEREESTKRSYWSWAYPQRENFFSDVDQRFNKDEYSFLWVDTAPIGIPSFFLRFTGEGKGQNFFAKFYGDNHLSVYEQERVLYLECGQSGLFLDYLEEFRLAQGRLVLYELEDLIFFGGERFENKISDIREALYTIAPSEGLIDIHRRSKGELAFDALNEASLSKLEIGCNSKEDMVVVKKLVENLDRLKDIISKVPLFVFNKELSKDNVLSGTDGKIKFISWSGWQILPIGVDQPLSVISDKKINDMINRVALVRFDSKHVSVSNMRVSNYAYNLLKSLDRDNCKMAVVFAEKIVDLLVLDEGRYLE